MNKSAASSPAASDFAVAALSRSGATLAVAASRLRRGQADPVEGVHELRVAIRRVRSDLRVFASSFDGVWVEDTRCQLRDLARVVGEARDVDVILVRLEQLAEALPQSDRPTIATLMAQLRRERGAALERALYALVHDDATASVKDLTVISDHRVLAPRSEQVVIDDLVAATRRRWRRLRESVRAAAETPSEESLHLVRVRAKTLRYSLETLAPVLHSSAREHAKALVALQNHLGEMQDADVIERWLRVARESSEVDGFVVGELVGFERARKEWVRATWRDQWREASRDRLRRWAR